MFDFLFKSPLWQVLSISDWISKYIIILGLFVLSVVCVAIIIFKYITFSFQKKRMLAITNRVKTARDFRDLANISKQFDTSIGGIFLKNSLKKLDFIINHQELNTVTQKLSMQEPDSITKKLSMQEIESLELLLNQNIDNLLLEEEAYLPVLGTSSAVAPLIGLFGTIWGLIHSFINISKEKTADISTVAPGIAAALLTTLSGLVVAIPAMIAFHYFSNDLRKLEAQLYELSDMFLFLVKKTFIK